MQSLRKKGRMEPGGDKLKGRRQDQSEGDQDLTTKEWESWRHQTFPSGRKSPVWARVFWGGVEIALGIGPHSAALGPAPLIPLPCFLPYSHVEWAKCCVTQPVGSKEKQNQAVQGGRGCSYRGCR